MDQVITARHGVGMTARNTQRQRLRFSRVTTSDPMLIIVKYGRKELRSPGFECVLEAGDAVAVAPGSVLDIINTPNAEGDYEAQWLVWDAALVSSYEWKNPSVTSIDLARRIALRSEEFSKTIRSATDAIGHPETVPDIVAKHRLLEVLAWLDVLGSRFDLHEPTTASALVRRLVATAPSSSWTAPEVARHLAMSEATLRRRLAAEGTRFGDLVMDIRMSYAKQLLQATNMSVTRIADEVGYESASRFAIRFRHHFRFAPSAIRGHQRADMVA